LTGGKRAAGDGYFIEPTIIADVDPKARLAQEEVFGPVLAVIKQRITTRRWRSRTIRSLD